MLTRGTTGYMQGKDGFQAAGSNEGVLYLSSSSAPMKDF